MTDPSAESPSPPPRRRWLRRCAWLIASLALLAIVLPNLVLQMPMVGKILKEKAVQKTGLALEWKRVWWNPARGLVFREITLPGPSDGEFAAGLKIESVTVLPDYPALLRKKLAIREITVVNPVAQVIRTWDGRWLIPGRFAEEPVAADPTVASLTPQIPLDPSSPPDASGTLAPALVTMADANVPPNAPGGRPPDEAASNPAPPGPEPVAVPPPPPPTGKLTIQGGKLEVVSSMDGKVLARIADGSLALGPSGGSVKAASIGLDTLGQWRECPVEIPLQWMGTDLLITLANRTEAERSLNWVARVGLAPGLPVAMEIRARNCPVGWLEIPANLGRGIYPESGEFSGGIRLLALARQPGAVAAILQAEARNLALPTTAWPGSEILDQWLGRTGANNTPDQVGIGKLTIQAGMRGARIEIPVFQVDAAGVLAASQFLIVPGKPLKGETTILLGAEGEERVRRLEEHLGGGKNLGFTGNTNVQLPDGSTARWKSRVLHWAGFPRAPKIDLWPDLGFLSLPDALAMLQADLLPHDPDKVELIPLLPP